MGSFSACPLAAGWQHSLPCSFWSGQCQGNIFAVDPGGFFCRTGVGAVDGSGWENEDEKIKQREEEMEAKDFARKPGPGHD